MEPRQPDRKSPAHLPIELRLGNPIIIYLTLCCEKRKRILARDAAHDLLINAWTKADEWAVGRYIIMPDHIHLFCSPMQYDSVGLGGWVGYWKRLISREWPFRNERPLWQKSYWDTQIRTNESYEKKWEYVSENPVREKLVKTPDLWPYRGEMHKLKWYQ